MQQFEGQPLTRADNRELEHNIKDLERKIGVEYSDVLNSRLRKLRRLRK